MGLASRGKSTRIQVLFYIIESIYILMTYSKKWSSEEEIAFEKNYGFIINNIYIYIYNHFQNKSFYSLPFTSS